MLPLRWFEMWIPPRVLWGVRNLILRRAESSKRGQTLGLAFATSKTAYGIFFPFSHHPLYNSRASLLLAAERWAHCEGRD